MFDTAGQAWVFLAMVYGGMAMGVVYDILCGLRHMLKAKLMLTGLFDLLFWGIAACLASIALAYAGGDLRPYTLLGLATGALLYAVGLGRLVRAAARFVTRILSMKKTAPIPAQMEGISKSTPK